MKTAIDPKDFDKQTALYTLRRVYWRNVFRICYLKEMPWDTLSEVRELRHLNESVLFDINGVKSLKG